MKKVITISSNNINKSLETRDILINKLINKNFEVSYDFSPDTELIISIGGDGSFLKTVHDFNFPNVPIVGINTGHLGFFPEICPTKIDDFINSYINNDFLIEERNLILSKICNKLCCIDVFALNEIVIKGDRSRTIHLDLKVNEKQIQKFSGDGMILSTSTGSTAYNYAAGGSLVDPSLNLMQLTPLYPINTNAYRSFTSSIIFSSESIITIAPEYRFEDSILIVIDGVEHRFSRISHVETTISDKKIKLLRMSNYEFWSRVSNKFL